MATLKLRRQDDFDPKFFEVKERFKQNGKIKVRLNTRVYSLEGYNSILDHPDVTRLNGGLYKTTNYRLFNLMNINRPIVPALIKRHEREWGVVPVHGYTPLFPFNLSKHPIIVNSKGGVRIGQHRFVICVVNGLVIIFRVDNTPGIEREEQSAIASTSQHDSYDISSSFEASNDPNFIALRKFQKEHSYYSMTFLYSYVVDENITDKSLRKHIINSGNIDLTGLSKLDPVTEYLDIVYPRTDTTREVYGQSNVIRGFVLFICWLRKNLPPLPLPLKQRFIEKLINNCGDINSTKADSRVNLGSKYDVANFFLNLYNTKVFYSSWGDYNKYKKDFYADGRVITPRSLSR